LQGDLGRALDDRIGVSYKELDEAFLADLPPGVDPCGERGEFHTFCTAGPMFTADIAVEVGERVTRDGFCFADLLPTGWIGSRSEKPG